MLLAQIPMTDPLRLVISKFKVQKVNSELIWKCMTKETHKPYAKTILYWSKVTDKVSLWGHVYRHTDKRQTVGLTQNNKPLILLSKGNKNTSFEIFSNDWFFYGKYNYSFIMEVQPANWLQVTDFTCCRSREPALAKVLLQRLLSNGKVQASLLVTNLFYCIRKESGNVIAKLV